ncbi:PREDICTED: F-box protein At3g57580-like [Camelina sativa]|uniref:F-box protein At3g57580-like n=1 Tax=Camelina sativa TaxID=90675 RepID=A0ABM0TK96_CAMSA|nr:PREDICTED: F-box protein At3g57580-like [Camelina sativa]
MERGKNMESLPIDLILEIFTRLPSKSVARFRTLSKHWASTLRSRDFKKLFLARSSARPRLLFAVERYQHNEWIFFSSPQRYEKSLPLDYHTKVSGDVSSFVCSYASGLIYIPFVRIIEKDTPLICNPITGMYEGYEVRKYSKSHGFLGFDPIDEQFKVLDQNSILTIGSGEVNWRTKKVSCDRFRLFDRCSAAGICINGVLYYLAITYGLRSFVIVRFDVRSEEFNITDAACFNDHLEHPSGLSLVNSNGKLGVVNCNFADAGGRRTVELCMSVLEDVETQEWVKYVYTLPQNEVLESCEFKVAGVAAATGDFVLCMKYTCKPYFVFYFNPEKNTLQSVEIHGFGAKLESVEDRGEVYAFVDHVEDLSVSDALQLKSSISHIKTLCACCKKVVQRDNIEEEV